MMHDVWVLFAFGRPRQVAAWPSGCLPSRPEYRQRQPHAKAGGRKVTGL